MVALGQCFYSIFQEAYKIRLYALEEYGLVIHEFDPYFNYRATEYLYANGWHAFSHWYDNQVWYPLGRPVGTTIYPGMQVTAVWIKNHLLPDMSINDICCYIPAWFGVLATISTALLAYECTCQYGTYQSILARVPVVYDSLIRPLFVGVLKLCDQYLGTTLGLDTGVIFTQKVTPGVECALFAAAIMSIVPAHLLRSVGGGYDNESVATTAMVFTFYCWVRSLRDNVHVIQSTMWGILTGLAYFYMVAAWGGYVFVLNLIGVHASLLVLFGRFTPKLYSAYTTFYLVGTYCATTVPVVGMTPLKSLEQLGPFVAFGAFQLLMFVEWLLKQNKQEDNTILRWKYRMMVFTSTAVVVAIISYFILVPIGYFGPLSSRVRGLFVKHTKTGNPLVDSVAEHQPASTQAYFQYLNHVIHIAPVGLGIVGLLYFNDSSSFLLVYAGAAYFFSHKMVRLILLTAPIASVLGGIALGHAWSWCLGSIFTNTPSFFGIWNTLFFPDEDKEQSTTPTVKVTPATAETEESDASANGTGSKSKKKKSKKSKSENDVKEPETVSATPATTPPKSRNHLFLNGDPIIVRLIRLVASAYLIKYAYEEDYAQEFYRLAHEMARGISHPTIIQKARTHSGQEVMIDDYREAYFWLKDRTPKDARIMAWWDYGYQITGISNRTTIADGNTWNHEHIALLGRTLTAPEKEGHRIARHLADYILVWTGGGGDDLAKSPHLIRIANSVYRGLCSEPTCRSFGFFSNGTPSPQLAASMLYKLHSHGLKEGVVADRNRFKLVFQSKYGKVRIFKILKVSQESKKWVADPENRLCDEGGWLCRGQYPPALTKVLKQKKDFQQLEDFNVQGEDDSEYQRQYMDNLMNNKGGGGGGKKSSSQPKKKPKKELTLVEIEEINDKRENNEHTTMMWRLISEGKRSELKSILTQNPQLAHIRSADGRGPMWWAHEHKKDKIVQLLKSHGVSEVRTDDDGIRAIDMRD